MYMEKDWQARFRVPPSTNWKAFFIVLALLAIIPLPILFPLSICLLLGLLPALLVSFVMRKLGRRPLNTFGIAAIAVGVCATLVAWWVVTWGNKPCDPCS